MRIAANSAVPWLGRGHVATERSNNSAVCTAYVLRIVRKKKNLTVGYDAVYSSRNTPCFGVV